MKRGELYRVSLGSKTDTKKHRVYVVASRQALLDSAYSTVICAPVYTNFEGLSTQVRVGIAEGLKHESAIRCDELVSLLKRQLTDYVGCLSEGRLHAFNSALAIALGIEA